MTFFFYILEVFNNREIALAIWVSIIIILMLIIKRFRQPLISFFKTSFDFKILILVLILIIALYGFGVILLLRLVNYWSLFLLKDTIIFYSIPAFILCVKYITSKNKDNLAKRVLMDNIEFLLILEFITNFYVFSLWVELIVIPFVTFIVLIDVVLSIDKKNSCVLYFVRILQSLIGFSVLGYSIYRVSIDFRNFGNINTLREFLLPVILIITFIPLIYLMVIYSRYDELFRRLDFNYRHDRKLRKYIKKRVIRNCFVNYKKVQNINYKWMNFKNIEDVEDFLKSIDK